MSDFLVAIGLVFAIEGILFAAFPGPVKRAMAHVTETPDSALRLVGIASAVIGVAAGLAGSGLTAADEAAFPPQSAGSVVVDEVLSA